MKTNIITIDEFLERSGKTWSKENDCEFFGIIPGYVCGWNVEAERDGKIDCASTTFTNDYEEIRNGYDSWNNFGIEQEIISRNGWTVTGNIVFRGYFREDYDFEERDYFYTDASDEVIALMEEEQRIWDKYVITEDEYYGVCAD